MEMKVVAQMKAGGTKLKHSTRREKECQSMK